MNIKILGHTVEMVRVKTDEDFANNTWGVADYAANQIKIGNPFLPLRCVIHELYHWHVWLSGMRMMKLEQEDQAQVVAAFFNTLINENGLDIFERIQRWLDQK